MLKSFTFAFVVLFSLVSSAPACGFLLYEVPDQLREKEIERLREMGPAGMIITLRQLDSIRDRALTAKDGEYLKLQEDLKTIKEVVDKVAGQRHAHISRLYWYTDLEKAKSEAVQSGKPILSLRMLGKLTDEFSCANSRFFRTALYANQDIAEILRERFVLHWASVRPVPKVTIDFGDGRKVERTVTGNSAHYILSTEGTPLDVLPGLYSPTEFKSWLQRAEELVASYNEQGDESVRSALLAKYHEDRLLALELEWTDAIRNVAPTLLDYRPDRPSADLLYVDAVEASFRAMSKQFSELPILTAIRVGPQQTDRMITDSLWNRIADHYRNDVELDNQSVELIRAERPNAFAAGIFALSKARVEDPILRLVRNFEDSIALDTVRNKFLLEREIHNWYASGSAPQELEQLNEQIYAQLFLTPSSDPWLGLVPRDTYTALDNGGLQPFISLSEIGPTTSLD